MQAVCSESGCSKNVHSRGLCKTHYEKNRWQRRRNGTCRDCGGPKPVGIGRKLCDACLEASRQRSREKVLEAGRRRYQANREKVLAYSRERSKDPEYRAAKVQAAREWAQKHPERVRDTQRRAWAKRKYGLTLEEVEVILARGCAICGTRQGIVVGRRGNLPAPEARLCIDHDHVNGKLRDALCHACNAGLGLYGDDPGRLRAAADYLEKHRAGAV